LLNSNFGRDITRLDPNFKLSNVTAHHGPVPNEILANFVTNNINL
jgi:hypothetical protein